MAQDFQMVLRDHLTLETTVLFKHGWNPGKKKAKAWLVWSWVWKAEIVTAELGY
jgi:hypothetical protein